MAKRVTLASTFTAKYYPSQKLSDAFYLDGRLRSIREERTADISFDREDRGFFLSLFTSDENTELKTGTYPSYEPKLSKFCTDVKYSGKKIDDMTRSFRELAVDITGKMMLQENESRSSYFSGLMVKDGEGFALTVGGGLAFLYRDDALYPLTDAGIPMEPIDAHGNNVGDFNNYYCSKSAHVLWSNFFRLNVDDCIILCNKELYSALGQRELLRILDDANDQCDAAGTIITQAAARKPNVPMQITISFVLDVKADEKKSFFKRRKKDDEDTEGLYVKSDFETGTLGQAAKASANAGFVAGYADNEPATETVTQAAKAVQSVSPVQPAPAPKQAVPVVDNTKILFGDDKVGGSEEPNSDADLKFFGTEEAKEPVVEISAEEMMKRLFSDAKPTVEETPVMEEPVVPMTGATIDTSAGINPFDMPADDSDVKEMKVVSSSTFVQEEDDSDTKAINSLDKFLAENKASEAPAISLDASGILATSLREQNVSSPVVEMVDDKTAEENKKEEEKKTEKVVEENPFAAIFASKLSESSTPEAPVVKADAPVVEGASIIGGSAVEEGNNILFTAGSVLGAAASVNPVTPTAEFNPYSVTNDVKTVEEVPFVFGDDSVDILKSSSVEEPKAEVKSVQEVKPVAEPSKEDVVETKLDDLFKELTADKPAEDADDTVKETEEEKEDTRGFFEVAKDAKEVLDAPEFTFGDDTVYDEEPEQNIDFPVTKAEKESNVVEANVLLPFESPVESVVENVKPNKVNEDIPPMPNFDGDTFNSPAYVPNTETPVGSVDNQNYAVGSYIPNEETNSMSQPFGSEPLDSSDYNDQFFGNQMFGNNINQAPDYGNQNDQFYDFSNQNAGFGGEGMDFDNEQPPYNLDQSMNGEPQQYADSQGQYYPGYTNNEEYNSDEMNAYNAMNEAAFFGAENQVVEEANPYGQQMNSNSSMNDDEIARILGMGGFDADFDGNGDSPEQVARPVQHKTQNNNQGGPRPVSKNNPQRNGTGRTTIKRREPTYFGLTKAGWIFIASVAFILIVICLMIGLGVSKCNANKEKEAKETKATEPSYQIVADPTTIATEPPVLDPSAPIGRFVFSDYIGFRTWRDLLSGVYGITIEETNDPRIALIVGYNGLPADYTPHSGDILLLPPMGVLDGSIPVTFSVNGSVPEAAQPEEVTGEINLDDGTTDDVQPEA